LNRQTREFLAQARKDGGREWAQNGLKYFRRAKKKRAKDSELAEATIRNFYKPVRLFYSVHDIELSWKKIMNTIPTGRKFANDRAPTHEEISDQCRTQDEVTRRNDLDGTGYWTCGVLQ
jgi:transposase InsO family protein